jgi:hypothetical protein
LGTNTKVPSGCRLITCFYIIVGVM